MSAAPEKVFRKAALDRLSSPEQLDRLVTITSPRSWIALSGLAVLAVFALAWGIFGVVPTNVPAKGLLVAEGGRVLAAMAPAGGVVRQVGVRLGETVTKGQQVIAIQQDEADRKLSGARDVLAEREQEQASRSVVLQRELAARKANLRQRAAALQQSANAAAESIAYQEKRARNHRDMLAKGFSTGEKLNEIETELNRARRDLADAQAQRAALDAEEVQAQLDTDRDLTRLADGVAEARRRIDELQTQIRVASAVIAPADGRVVEVKVSDGAVVATGQPLLSIETTGSGLQAVVYIPTEHGKKVLAGMPGRISPAPVQKEEFGTLLGRVAAVSAYPATREGMAGVLHNAVLVDAYLKEGAPYEARIDLTAADTPSGYAWTSVRGPDIDLTSGTTVEATIAVREQAPITLILPFLRKILGVDG